MFRCERCGAGYNATVGQLSETCPRCEARGVVALLRFRLFEQRPGSEAAKEPVPSGNSEQERRQDSAS